MSALSFGRKPARFAAARVMSEVVPGGGGRVGPLTLDPDAGAPPLPGPDWIRIQPRLSGICGSDLASIDGRSSRYFEPIVSFPFTPGHEVVADREDTGERVVLEPVLGCAARNISPVCRACAEGRLGNCERIAFGALPPGLQSGFCSATGGGWSNSMVAHPSQLHPVDAELTDEDAVMIEPAACAVHAALLAGVSAGDTVVVIGAGTLGLLTVAALNRWSRPDQLVVAGRYPEQERLATEFGADLTLGGDELRRVVRRVTNSLAVGRSGAAGAPTTADRSQLTGGADVVIDCVGSADSLDAALAVVRPRGRIVLVGMPGTVKLDLTSLWHREVELVGAYAYGTETVAGATYRTFDLAAELVAARSLGRLVSATYPLGRYTEALEHAATAGRRGGIKIAFDLRTEHTR